MKDRTKRMRELVQSLNTTLENERILLDNFERTLKRHAEASSISPIIQMTRARN